MSEAIQKIVENGVLLAIVVRGHFNDPGCTFFTPEHFPFQLGVHVRPAADEVKAHQHVPFSLLKDLPAQEWFYVVSGKVEVSLLHGQQYHSTHILDDGDMMLLNCGHKVTFLKPTKMIELKQGPYRGRDVEKEFI